MSYFDPSGKMTYHDYLTAKSFADDMTQATRGAGKRVAMEISHGTREIIASNEALAAENIRLVEASTEQLTGALDTGFSQVTGTLDAGFDRVSNTLDQGFERLSYGLGEISSGISELNATFHWGFGEMLAVIGHMNDSLTELIRIAKTPAQTAAYEQYEIARDAFRQGLYQECLEAVDKAIAGDHTAAGYKLEWRFHQMKGTLRLGFADGDLSLVDLAKAEESFLLAARYAKADYPEHSGQAFLSAGWSAYCQGRMAEALAHTEQAMAIHPRLGEAFFQAAKVHMALGEVDKALPVLGQAIELDRFFALKAAGDGDFHRHDSRLCEFLDALRQEKHRQSVPKVRAALDRLRFWRDNAPEAKGDAAVQRMEEFVSQGGSWPLLDMLAVVQPLDELVAAIEGKAKRAIIRKQTKEPVVVQVEESYDVEEPVPVTETYTEEVVVRPAGLFRKAVTERQTKTRTVMKTRVVQKTRMVSRESVRVRDEFFSGLGQPLPKFMGDVLDNMVAVKGGAFQMGDTFGDGDDEENPVHEVRLGDFSIGRYPVTQGLWQAVMGNNPSRFTDGGPDCPVEQVSWDDAQDFIDKLNGMFAGTGGRFRLPTEAEWEYAARSGGKKEKWAGTSSEDELGNLAWYDDNAGGKTHPVGQKRPNGLGLYDMSGNVWEWCQDWFGDYLGEAATDPQGPSSGSERVLRGGSSDFDAGNVRAAVRNWCEPGCPGGCSGFRLALSPGQ